MRQEYDFYPTPIWAIERLFRQPEIRDFLSRPGLTILEPCAGDGRIVATYARIFREASLTTNWNMVEIRPESKESLEKLSTRDIPYCYTDTYCPKDFLEFKKPGPYSAVITNPPFSLWVEFVEKSLTLSPVVIMLLRNDVVGSKKRKYFWEKHHPMKLCLAERPSFTSDGKTDSAYYSWFVWGLGQEGTWRVI